MSRRFTCPLGHQWESSTDLTPEQTEAPVCSVCASLLATPPLPGPATQSHLPWLPSPAARKRPAGEPLVQVPGYHVMEELGRGGMGVVSQARQAGLNRLGAL